MFSQQHPFTLFEAQNEAGIQHLTKRLYIVPVKKEFTMIATVSINLRKEKSQNK